MSTRVPPSTKPPSSQQTAQAQRLRRSTKPAPPSDKPRPIKSGGNEEALSTPEAQAWQGQDLDKSLEMRADELEAKLAELGQSEEAKKEEGAEQTKELHEAAEKDEKKGIFKIFSWQKQGAAPKTDAKTAMQKAQEAKQEALKKLPGFKPTAPTNLTGVSASRLQAVGQLTGQSASNERPPDAFSLLKEAREKGVLFVEDALAEGHSEEKDDPEHAAAVEACITQCFGIRGILRIGPGHNDKNEKIIVVATTHGFTAESFSKVPEKVHRFATLIAIPFDLLPLKRDRP